MGEELIERYPTFRSSIANLEQSLAQLAKSPTWLLSEVILAPPAQAVYKNLWYRRLHVRQFKLRSLTSLAHGMLCLHLSWLIPRGDSCRLGSSPFVSIYCHCSIFSSRANGEYRVFKRSRDAGGLNRKEAQKQIHAQDSSQRSLSLVSTRLRALNWVQMLKRFETLPEKLQQEGIFARKLKASGKAYHSHRMKRFGGQYHSSLHCFIQVRIMTKSTMADFQMQADDSR